MKAALRHILLAALLIRALLPLGWMPGQAQLGEAAFIICAADGSIQHGTPGKNESAKPHQPCAFASAAQLFDLPEAAAIASPSLTVVDGQSFAVLSAAPAAAHPAYPARAPPAL